MPHGSSPEPPTRCVDQGQHVYAAHMGPKLQLPLLCWCLHTPSITTKCAVLLAHDRLPCPTCSSSSPRGTRQLAAPRRSTGCSRVACASSRELPSLCRGTQALAASVLNSTSAKQQRHSSSSSVVRQALAPPRPRPLWLSWPWSGLKSPISSEIPEMELLQAL